jgi:hypothetical protein
VQENRKLGEMGVVPQFEIRFRQSNQYARPLNITAGAIRLYNHTLRQAPSLTSYVSLFYFRES